MWSEVHDWIHLICPGATSSWIYCFACTLLIPQQIPSGSFASYAINSALSASALCLTAHFLAVELFVNFYLFEKIWFNLFSGTCYGINCYMNGAKCNSTSYNMICPNLDTITSYQSSIIHGWVTAPTSTHQLSTCLPQTVAPLLSMDKIQYALEKLGILPLIGHAT